MSVFKDDEIEMDRGMIGDMIEISSSASKQMLELMFCTSKMKRKNNRCH